MRYGFISDDEYTSSHRRERLTIWSGAFCSVLEGEAYSRPKGWTVTTYNGDVLHVNAPAPRTDENYREVDAKISAALNQYETAREGVQMTA